MSGWIKLHRKLKEWEWYQDSQMVHLFIHLLFKANYEPKKWRGVDMSRGQLLTGRKQLSNETGISEQSIRTCLERLRSTNELTIKSTNSFSIITVCNYDSYQLSDDDTNQQSNQASTSNQPSINQASTTSKKEKKDKELKEFKEEALTHKDKYSEEMVKEFIGYWTEENQSGTKMRFQLEKTWGLARRLATWNKRDKQYKPGSKKNLYPDYKDSSFD